MSRPLAALSVCLLLACAHAAPAPDASPASDSSPPDVAAIGRQFVERLSQGAFADAAAMFDPSLSVASLSDKLSATWQALQGKLGAFRSIDHVSVAPDGADRAAFVETKFTLKAVALQVVVNPHGQIIGFFVHPSGTGAAWAPPAYADPHLYSEQAVEVGSSPALPGHLTLPTSPGPFPVAILVQGSGPNDEDESIGSNKPFKDLADGLASRGVAVLRYDKRTHLPPKLPTSATVRQEYFESLAAALALVRRTPALDPRRIVVVGHSEGAYLAPWIARDTPGLAGIALLAAPARGTLDAAVEQIEQLARQHPDNPELAAQVTAVRRDRDRLRSPDLRPDEILFHAPATYWLALRDYAPVATAAALSLPIFIAQGDRDYNVSPTADYPLWQSGLAGHRNVVFKLYPNLNHLFIAWGGTPDVQDNLHAGHVAKQLVDDLAAWIQSLPASTPLSASPSLQSART